MYFEKKRVLGTYGPFVEDVFVKLGDLAAAELLPALVTAIGSAKSKFLKAEACRVLSSFLKQFKAVSDASRATILKHCPGALGHVATALAALGDKGTALAKLARPLLTCAKDVLVLLKAQSTSGSSKELVVAGATKKALIAALAPYKQSTSPIVVSVAAQVLLLLGVTEETVAAPSTSTTTTAAAGKKGGSKGGASSAAMPMEVVEEPQPEGGKGKKRKGKGTGK